MYNVYLAPAQGFFRVGLALPKRWISGVCQPLLWHPHWSNQIPIVGSAWKSWKSTRVWWNLECFLVTFPPCHLRLSQDILQYTGKPRILGTGSGFSAPSFAGYGFGGTLKEPTAFNSFNATISGYPYYYFRKQPIGQKKRARRLEPPKSSETQFWDMSQEPWSKNECQQTILLQSDILSWFIFLNMFSKAATMCPSNWDGR